MDKDTFQQKIAEGAFLEWEEVYPDRFYGTLTKEVERIWELGKHLIFDVDVKGAISIKKYFGKRSIAVFIEPPNLETLIDRLKNRGTESSETLNHRINRIKNELTYTFQFDKIIVNDILDVTLKEAEMIVEEFIK
jgi:guanylate kinase